MNKNRIFFSIFILFVATIFRMYGIHWDNGYHFHPDERMLIMVADRIKLFSQLNPDFFNYGSLPVYILRAVSQSLDYLFTLQTANYDGLLIVGRSISIVLDILVILLIYKVSKSLFNSSQTALWSMFFYSIAFFPIQNSHFFVVDVFLNFFATLLLYLLLKYHENPTYGKIIMIAITYAAALTTKVSALIFLPIIFLVLTVSHTKRLYGWKQLLSKIMAVVYHQDDTDFATFFRLLIIRGFTFIVVVAATAFLFMPYAFFEYQRFLSDILLQTKMNSDPYIFPYTLQYVNTTPYLYYLKNIFLWGVGPIIGIIAIVGLLDMIISFLYTLKENIKTTPTTFKKILHLANTLLDNNVTIVLIFYGLYFLVIGNSAVKFMRYMLPLYPFIALLAGRGASRIQQAAFEIRSKRISIPIIHFFAGIALIWTLAFVSIYTKENTRIRATQWINQYIPAGSVLAVEHWDDRVPIFDPGKYQYAELPLYEQPDNEIKWKLVEERLQSADYIILASNRLYVPLQKLNDCNKFKSCYPITAQYYEDLFAEKRGFIKLIEFSSYPQLSLGGINLTIYDDAADESFTVYDHPKIIIFKKQN